MLESIRKNILYEISSMNDANGIGWNQIYSDLKTKFSSTHIDTYLKDLEDDGLIEMIGGVKSPDNPYIYIPASPIRITSKGRCLLSPREKVRILSRYKTLCEWYDKGSLISKKETDLTQSHLSKYLFDQGLTYSLAEVNVPSGRIDNLGISLHTGDIIVVEGKIFDGNKNDIVACGNQLLKRLNDFQIMDGYCVIYNKKPCALTLNGTKKEEDFFVLESGNGKKVYFLVVDLYGNVNSTSPLQEIIIDLTN